MDRFLLGKAAPISVARDFDADFRIAGGNTAAEGQFPYQVSLWDRGTHICSGSILSAQWVLTAAHCVSVHTGYMRVLSGTNSLLYGGHFYRVARAAVHSEYDWSSKRNDIALLKIHGAIAFNAKVQPIPLETSDVGAGEFLVISGWGSTCYPGDVYCSLQFLNLKSISNVACKELYAHTPDIVDDTQLCTFTQRGYYVSKGDCGGPLAHNGKLVGIASCGQPCAHSLPHIFTRVSSFVDWIKSHNV